MPGPVFIFNLTRTWNIRELRLQRWTSRRGMRWIVGQRSCLYMYSRTPHLIEIPLLLLRRGPNTPSLWAAFFLTWSTCYVTLYNESGYRAWCASVRKTNQQMLHREILFPYSANRTEQSSAFCGNNWGLVVCNIVNSRLRRFDNETGRTSISVHTFY